MRALLAVAGLAGALAILPGSIHGCLYGGEVYFQHAPELPVGADHMRFVVDTRRANLGTAARVYLSNGEGRIALTNVRRLHDPGDLEVGTWVYLLEGVSDLYVCR